MFLVIGCFGLAPKILGMILAQWASYSTEIKKSVESTSHVISFINL